MFRTNLSAASEFWTEAVFGDMRTSISVLIVADGKLSFLPDETGFSFSRLCLVLASSALPWEIVNIATAHRSGDLGATIEGPFVFDAVDPTTGEAVFSLDLYDQLWLFGAEGEFSKFNLSPSEILVISDFMKAGGGVFATGDHQDLGFALCAKLPRVGTMRKWSFFNPATAPELRAPDRNGPSRLDSLREGEDEGFQGRDEHDNVPQEIRPKFFVDPSGKTAYPHPLLANNPFAISILPDHLHEGECNIPETLDLDEYPEMLDMPIQVSPVVVAIATSASGIRDILEPLFPVEPRCYKVIVAYDGHLVKRMSDGRIEQLGRVAVDASFHHFLNFNLHGFADDQHKPSKEFEIISKYYSNLLHWLCPPYLQVERYHNLLLGLRFSPSLREEFEGRSKDNWADILHAGRVTHKSIATSFSKTEANLCALAVASKLSPETQDALNQYLYPWHTSQPKQQEPSIFFDPENIAQVLLGSALLGISSELPESYYDADMTLPERHGRGKYLQQFANQGLEAGITFLAQAIKDSNSRLDTLADRLKALQ